MAFIEPLTDGVKAFRELIGAISDLAGAVGKVASRIEKSRRQRMADELATLYFDEAWIPTLLTDLERHASRHDKAALYRVLEGLGDRLSKTEEEVVRVLLEIDELKKFLRTRFGISYANCHLDTAKGAIRERIDDLRYKIYFPNFDPDIMRKEALAIQELIRDFNAVVGHLHDQLLGIEPGKIAKL